MATNELVFKPGPGPETKSKKITGRYFRRDAKGREYFVIEQKSTESANKALGRAGYMLNLGRPGGAGVAFAAEGDTGNFIVQVVKLKK